MTTLPMGTATSAFRSRRVNATAMRLTSMGWSATRHRLADELTQARRPHPLLVLAVLEDGAEGDVNGVLVELGSAEGGQGRGPVDGLGHARRLVELHPPQLLDGARHLAAEALHD